MLEPDPAIKMFSTTKHDTILVQKRTVNSEDCGQAYICATSRSDGTGSRGHMRHVKDGKQIACVVNTKENENKARKPVFEHFLSFHINKFNSALDKNHMFPVALYEDI